MSSDRPDIVAIAAVNTGDIDKLKSVIDSPIVNYHEIFTTAVKNNKSAIIEWMMHSIMTTQIYPMGRLDAAVVATVIVKYGEQPHLEQLAALYRGHIKGLMRPEVIVLATERGLNVEIC
ncbi:hypothetical protein F-S17_0461 [Faustovirus]|nr:hypothetical protein F-S17_0461 [Faustovirus]